MTVCPVGECTNPLPPHPSLWVTSTNPAIECCSASCAQTQMQKIASGARIALDQLVDAERLARREAS